MTDSIVFVQRLEDSLDGSDLIEVKLKNDIVLALVMEALNRCISEKEYAEVLGISERTLRRWLGGECNFSIRQIAEICNKLELIPQLVLRKAKDV